MSRLLTSYDAARTHGDGVQPWSAGPLYPWVDETVIWGTDDAAKVRLVHPDGRATHWRYCLTDAFGFEIAAAKCAEEARALDARAKAIREAKAAIREAGNVYDLFAAIVHHDEVQAAS